MNKLSFEVADVMGNGDSSVYELFYSQGATFWYELDSAINQASNETRSLDEYIADLLQADFTLDEGLPASFIDSMHQLVGIEKFDALVKRYLGE